METVSEVSTFQTAESVVLELHDIATFPAGASPDWGEMKALFADEARVVMRESRESRESTKSLSADEFVEDFRNVFENSSVKEKGFNEKIIRMKTMEFRDVAHVLVPLSCFCRGIRAETPLGIDSFQLVRSDDSWRILSIANDIPTTNHPIPSELQ